MTALVQLACVPAVPVANPDDLARARTRWPSIGHADLAAGRTLYMSRCGNCHQLYAPQTHAPEQWLTEVEEMAERSQLDEDQAQSVTRYLVALSSRTSVADVSAAPKPEIRP